LYADPEATLSQNLIRDNTVYHNLEVGILLEPGAGNNYILENLVETNHGMGIVILSDSNTVVKNDVLDNATDGISFEGNNNLIIKNTALDNDGWDLADYGLRNRWLFNEYGTSSWETEVGWVVSESPGDGYGVILHTTDGGDNWVRQGSPGEIPDTQLASVSAIDGCNAWVAGGIADGFGVILRTTDGGKSWVRQGAAGQIPDLSTAAVYAVNKHIAWVVGQNGLILHTIDGGRTWIRQAQDTAPGYNLEGVYASDPWNVWAVGGKNQKPCPDDICGIILHSSNGGWTWEQQTFTPSDGNLGGYLITVHGLNAKNVWAVGNASGQHTTDGGETWQNVTPLNGGGFYDWNGVFAVNENNVWVARDNDGIYQYDGDTWNKFSPPPPAGSGGFHLVRVSAVDPQSVWVSGPSFLEPDKGIIVHTDDGGVTWEQQDPGFEAGFWGVSFVKSAVCNL
jgi:parallel beta-helix repeat protein